MPFSTENSTSASSFKQRSGRITFIQNNEPSLYYFAIVSAITVILYFKEKHDTEELREYKLQNF
ncbi:MAG: hypothetical protein INQ03_08905 [Candidatus Heimdallarchaeota archaeon]|nr:hypothetical protein [Candidatus Heimdallarchaeota archaeon]